MRSSITPSDLGSYPSFSGCTPEDVFGAISVPMAALAIAVGFDVLTSGDFWEYWVSLQLGGEQTARKHIGDVAVGDWLAEVKFSNAFIAMYAGQPRPIFKWAFSPRQRLGFQSNALILIGYDVDRTIHSWVIPPSSIPLGKHGLTVTAPSHREGSRQHGRIDTHKVPATELLPAFIRCCRGTDTKRGNHGSPMD